MFSREEIEEAIESCLGEMKGALRSSSILEQESFICILRVFGAAVIQELYNRKGEYDE